MLTNSVFVLIGGLEEPTITERLYSILSAIGSLFDMFIEQVQKICTLIVGGVEVVGYAEFQSVAQDFVNSGVNRSFEYDASIDQYILYQQTGVNPLLFIFLCICLIGLGVTIYRRLANVN